MKARSPWMQGLLQAENSQRVGRFNIEQPTRMLKNNLVEFEKGVKAFYTNKIERLQNES